jgi:hypothetical protein
VEKLVDSGELMSDEEFLATAQYSPTPSRPKKLRGDSAFGRVSRRDRTIFSSAKKTLRTDVSVALGPERPERWANNAAILCLDYASLLLP